MSYGVTPNGFVIKPFAQVVADVETKLQGRFGAGINLLPESVFGQLIGTFGGEVADVWQLGQAIYNAFSADGAIGTSLDNVAGLTGTIREAAIASSGLVVLVGTNGTAVGSGSQVKQNVSGAIFATTASVSIATLPAWAGATGYSAGVSLVTHDTGKMYLCVQSGTSGAGPTGTGTGIVDGTCLWDYVATAPAGAVAPVQATSTGPIPAGAGTLTVINTPVAGWTSVTNPQAVTVGTDMESDPALRQRRAAALGGTGNADLDAIRAKVLAVTDALGDHPVTYCTVFENITDATDGAGRPPHSIEVLCQYPALAATDLAVATAIFQAKAAGIQTYGAGTVVSESVLDSSGGTHTIAFSKPTLIRIYVIANVIKGPNYPTAAPPADGPTLIANALVAYAADKWQPGVSVKDALLYGPVQDACDVADITSIFIGIAPAPGSAANIAIGVRQQATLAFADITVNAS